MASKNSEDFELLNYKSLLPTIKVIDNYLRKRSMNYHNFDFSYEESPKYVQFIVKKNFVTSQKFYCKTVQKSKYKRNLTLNEDYNFYLSDSEDSQNLADYDSQRNVTVDKICELNSDSFDKELSESQINKKNAKKVE